MKKIFYFIAALAVMTLAACVDDADNSKPMNVYTTFLDIRVKDSFVVSMTDDCDSSLLFPRGLKVSKALHHPDTTYRYVMTFGMAPGEPISIYSDAPVLTKLPVQPDQAKTTKVQPLNFVSSWRGDNGKYINLVLGMMVDNSKNEQLLDLVEDSTVVNSHGITHHYVSLRHDQNGVSEMFTEDLFVSVPISQYGKMDSVTVTIPSYKGLIKKTYKVGK